MRATGYGMEGKTLQHFMISALILTLMLFETILQAFDLPAEEVLGQISNIRITKMWMKDSVVLLHSLNPSQWGGCCTKIINWMPVRVIY
jgi:hypothetical protein